jgi:hypothetical protein
VLVLDAVDLASKRLTADAAEPSGKEPISRRARLPVPGAASCRKSVCSQQFGAAARAENRLGKPANSSRWASIAIERAVARFVSARGRECAEMGVQRRSWFNRVRVLAAGVIPAARSAFSHWAKVVMTPS